MKETYDVLNRLINECEIEENKYMFYFFKFEEDEDKIALFFAQKFRNLLHESNVFSLSTTESLSSHIFLATHAKNIYTMGIN